MDPEEDDDVCKDCGEAGCLGECLDDDDDFDDDEFGDDEDDDLEDE